MTLHLHSTIVAGCYRCELGQVEARAANRETIKDAREFISAWRWDDQEFPIPSDSWGEDLAFYIDVLLGATEEGEQA